MGTLIDTGGFVYPIYLNGDSPTAHAVDYGISRRDWLAGMAMSGLVVATGSDKDSMHPKTALEVARAAYHIADVMIRLSNESDAEPVSATVVGAISAR